MNNPIAEPLMGVVVQGLINSDISGVIFSQNPVTHDDRELLISASYGLGKLLYLEASPLTRISFIKVHLRFRKKWV